MFVYRSLFWGDAERTKRGPRCTAQYVMPRQITEWKGKTNLTPNWMRGPKNTRHTQSESWTFVYSGRNLASVVSSFRFAMRLPKVIEIQVLLP